MEKNNFDNKFRNFNKEVNSNANVAVENNAETAEIKNAVEEAAKTGMSTKEILVGAGILTVVVGGVLYYFRKKWFGKKEEQPATTEVKNGEFEDVK